VKAQAGTLIAAALVALTFSAPAKSTPKLTDLLQYYGVTVGPATGKLPKGLVCKIQRTGRCHCDAYMHIPGVGISGIDGPSKRCGLPQYSITYSPSVEDGHLPVAAREFGVGPDALRKRYGRATYSDLFRDGAGVWKHYVYCTDMDGKLLSASEVKPEREMYQFTFAYDGERLAEMSAAWARNCDPNSFGTRPVP
jgi:hypothetical protein